MEVKVVCQQWSRDRNERQWREMFPPYLRAWTQMGKEIKEERIEYKREGAMSFRAVANQANRRRKARHKENER